MLSESCLCKNKKQKNYEKNLDIKTFQIWKRH